MDLLIIKKYAIETPLQTVGLGLQGGVDQVFYTGELETRYKTIYQVNGPALSWFQIEPATHTDVKHWLLNGLNGGLTERILKFCNLKELPLDDYLLVDQRYAAIICRLVYFRNKAPMPTSKNAIDIANTHKLVYNTKDGKADPIANAKIIQELIDKGI
jgi:hypothetical protein